MVVSTEAFNYIKSYIYIYVIYGDEYTCIFLILRVTESNERALSKFTVSTFTSFYKIWLSTKTLETQI